MYLNLIQIAESFGVSEKVVEDWIRSEGMPHVPDRGRRAVRPRPGVAWAAEQGSGGARGFPGRRDACVCGGRRLRVADSGRRHLAGCALRGGAGTFERIVSVLPGLAPAVRRMLAGWVKARDGINWAPVGAGFALPHLRARVALGHDRGAVAILLFATPSPWRTAPGRCSRHQAVLLSRPLAAGSPRTARPAQPRADPRAPAGNGPARGARMRRFSPPRPASPLPNRPCRRPRHERRERRQPRPKKHDDPHPGNSPQAGRIGSSWRRSFRASSTR